MSRSGKLTLIIANGSNEAIPQLGDVALRAWLAKAAGQGIFRHPEWEESEARDHLDYELHLLAALGLQSHAKTFASAPVCLAAEQASGFWVRAEPMHFAAGMTRIDAVPLTGAAMLNDAERAEIGATIGDYVTSVGLNWDAKRWLIGFAHSLDVQTRQPNLAAELESAMPAGVDAKEMRRLMTELQMVLHEHPVNVRRSHAGLPAANAVWVWGGGSVIAERRNSVSLRALATDSTSSSKAFTTDPSSSTTALATDPSSSSRAFTTDPSSSTKALATDPSSSPKVFATDPFALGLAFLNGSQVMSPESAAHVLNASGGVDGVVVLDLRDSKTLLEGWLRPLQAALENRRMHSLIIAIDRWTIQLTRASSWRFWRKILPLEQWGAA